MIDVATRNLVPRRADNRCEYCRAPQAGYELRFHVDHVIASQHGGPTTAENLAFCCPKCNRKKGPNIAGIDPETGALTSLFDPRRQMWAEHFRWDGPRIVALSVIGRVTVATLDLNSKERLQLRRALLAEGLLP